VKPRARFQNLKFLGPYDNFWSGCGARGGRGDYAGGRFGEGAGGRGLGREGAYEVSANGLGPYFFGGSGLILVHFPPIIQTSAHSNSNIPVTLRV
jgi:hypothetical protein